MAVNAPHSGKEEEEGGRTAQRVRHSCDSLSAAAVQGAERHLKSRKRIMLVLAAIMRTLSL